MNSLEGKRMSRVFFKYYHERPIESMDDKRMIDQLVIAGYTESTFNKDGIAVARATSTGRKLHSVVPPGY
ncbi:MAG: hypothetical protein FWH47_05475 [Methanomassiliicoccaceae archaeon]|nr:hypothetical protein [Methanomassiliicoccaceae archaeon]